MKLISGLQNLACRCGLILMVVFFLGCFNGGLRAGTETGALSIGRFFRQCGLPCKCNQKLQCAGQQVLVWGYIDFNNVFDHRRSPQLPYEKFVLYDDEGERLEVWVNAAASQSRVIFERISQWSSRAKVAVVVQGRVEAVKMYTSGGCRQGVKLIINNDKQLELKVSPG